MRRRGFTLIELLVVIAIIGILAAMLFPVFARARESARKTQCLSNVKNIATAVNMYLSDYDRWTPNETDRVVQAFFYNRPGRGSGTRENCNHATHANPYLRDQVILEDYIQSREIWKCPSAKMMNGASWIVPMGTNGRWLSTYVDTEGEWGRLDTDGDSGPCYPAWPPGWGGDITNSFVQGLAETQQSRLGAGANVFVAGIGLNENLKGQSMSVVADPAKYVIAGDSGRQLAIWDANGLAFPDTCAIGFCDTGTSCGIQKCGNVADWDNCPDSQICGLSAEALYRFFTDPSYQKTYARHMGGSNLGFVDGHAKWSLYKAIMSQNESYPNAYFLGVSSGGWPGDGMVPADWLPPVP